MQITTVMVVMLIVWCSFTLMFHPETRHLPPMPTHQSIMAANEASMATRWAGWPTSRCSPCCPWF